MKYILNILILFFAAMTFASTQQQQDGTELQDGGGGVFKDGRYMTYHSARIPIKSQPSSVAQIPGMKLLLERLAALPVLDEAKTRLLASVVPSAARQYHNVPAEVLNPKMRKSIVAQYAKIFKCDESEVVLFAITDPVKKTTALFPEFFKLKETEQAAILFHETLWVLGKSFTYQDVLDLEGAAQAYFENPQDEDAAYNFFYKISYTLDQGLKSFLSATLQFDSVHPAAELVPADGKIALQDLLGERWTNCILYVGVKCKDVLLPELILKSQQHPHSLFRRALIEFMTFPSTQIMATRLIGYLSGSKTKEAIEMVLNEGFYVDARLFGPSIISGQVSMPISRGRQGPVIAWAEFAY